MIDLASDTVTRPTAPMLEAMANSPVGDDVFGLDPTVNALQEKAADLFGMQAALFCPSGTMSNQIAINIHTRPGDEIICHSLAHIYLYEGGGLMANSGASVKLLGTPDGLMTPADIEPAINNADDPHAPRSRVVALENTSNKGGGTCYDFATVKAIGDIAAKNHLAYHLDGARLFNALVESGDSPLQYGRCFDSISICLSKGLGCPVGSLLLGEHDFIREAVRVRKRLGGGWRQAGYLAGAGIYALDNNIDRLRDDHARAARLGRCLERQSWVSSVNPVQSNIVIFHTTTEEQALRIAEAFMRRNVRVSHLGHKVLRMVTHLDVDDAQIEQVCDIANDLPETPE
ncbi:MAG: low specificity L-threonine aldolase [Congregibacter sp.]